MKHVAAFFAIGALLFGVRRGIAAQESERPALVITVPARATTDEVERAIDQAVLTNLALSGPALRADPIVREQLLRAMDGVQREPGERAGEAELERAIALGVHRADPVVRERLAFQGEQMLRARLSPLVPSDAQLEAYLAEHAARYREPERVTFRQVFLARSRRGAQLERDAAAIATRLEPLAPGDPALLTVSDPTILPLRLEAVSERDIDARLGPGVGEAVLASPERAWSKPVASAYGLHFVWIETRTPAGLPPLHQLRAQVRADFEHDALRTRLAAELAGLRKSYRIDVRRSGS
jgi:peptidyl-prolyl cis-trans isomerase C